MPFRFDPYGSFMFGRKRSVHVCLGQIPTNCNYSFITIIAFSNEATEIIIAVFNAINPGNRLLHIPIKFLENFIWIFCITVDANRYEIKLNHISLYVGLTLFINGQGNVCVYRIHLLLSKLIPKIRNSYF